MCGLFFKKYFVEKVSSKSHLKKDCIICQKKTKKFLEKARKWVRGNRLLDLNPPCLSFSAQAKDLGWDAEVLSQDKSRSENGQVFDLILARGVFSVTEEPASMVSVVRRLLRAGGVLVVWDMDGGRLFDRPSKNKEIFTEKTLNLWCIESMTRLLGSFGIGAASFGYEKPFGRGFCFSSEPGFEWIGRG